MIVKFCGELKQKIVVDKFEKLLLENDDSLILELNNEKEILVKSEPLFCDNEPCVSYCSLIKIEQNKLECDNANIFITKYPKNYYKIFIKKIIINQNNPQNNLISANVLDCNCKLINSFPQKIIIEKNGKKCEKNLQKYVKNAKICEFNGCIMIVGDCEINEKYCGLFSANGDKLAEIMGHKIETTEKDITSLQYLNDVSGHGYVCVYSVEKNDVKLEKSYTVYMEETAKTPANDFAICWAYVEALNIGNLKLARSFLSEELNEILNDDSMIEYFGNYSEMEQNWITENQNLIWVISTDKRIAKGYIFEINGKKICNIDTI